MTLQQQEVMQLKWPEGWERTRIESRKPQAAWKKSTKGYIDALIKELGRMGVTECMISFNRDDKARLDPGVAVYFSKNSKADFSWQAALGLDTPAPTLDEIDAAYKRKAMEHHPDRGGDVEVFRQLTKHRDRARAWILGTHESEHEFVIPCDRFNDVRLNIAAIRLAITAFRQLDRVGVPSILERTFRGFRTALPQNASEDQHVASIA
jgi:hypothetical protein